MFMPLRISLVFVLAVMLVHSGTAWAACENVVPEPAATSSRQTRPVTAEDLASLRDIGQPDAALIPPESPLAVSPDGGRLAFVITQPVPGTNAWCRALVVMDVRPGAQPRIIDRGGEYMMLSYPLRGFMVHSGYPDLVVPAWSPDGRMIAYRKRMDGRTQAWVVAADGSGARAVGRFDADVEAADWSADGHRLIVALRPGLAEQEQRIASEASRGFVYDDRFAPNDAARPALAGPEPRELLAVDLASGRIAKAGPGDARRMSPDFPPGVPATLVASSASGSRAWLAPEASSIASPMRVHAQTADGRTVTCRAEACRGSIPSLLWVGGAVVFTRREGWASESMSLFRWVPGQAAPRRIVSGGDLIQGCAAAGKRLVCLVENAVTPRRVEAIDLADGDRQVLFDPNPEFQSLRLGEIRRLRYRNSLGFKVRGDLVLPPGYKGGRLPLVVVQYHSQGFLRGGTGDDYPIHAFAAQGIAVLSLERPRDVASLDPAATTAEAINAANQQGWAEKRSLLSAIETGVNEAIRLGIADPQRIGITGLSDGATTAAFALINSHMFAAAAISSCCLDPNTAMTYGGPRWAESLREMGYPPVTRADPDFWKPMSLAMNAGRVRVPLLMQLADREYLLALEAWTALKDHGKPVEMYVFADEYHYKWQPAHRLAVYKRSLDWFAFWLAGRRDPDPGKADQYRRWEAMKRARDKGGA